jgi:hypothetical protein
MTESSVKPVDTISQDAPADRQLQFDGESVESKLDARLYAAEDANGVLDGVAATGNVNQALLQERLRAETMSVVEASTSQWDAMLQSDDGGLHIDELREVPQLNELADRSSMTPASHEVQQPFQEGVASTASSVPAAHIAAAAHGQGREDDVLIESGGASASAAVEVHDSPLQSADGVNGVGGNNGVDGQPGASTGGGTVTQVVETVTTVVEMVVDGTLDTVTDAVDGVVDAATGVVDQVADAVNDIVGDVSGVVGHSADAVTDTVGVVTDSVGDVLADVTGAVGSIADTLGDVLPDLGGGGSDHADTDLTIGLALTDGSNPPAALDLDVVLDPVEAMVGDIDIDVDANADVTGTVGQIADATDGAIAAVTDTASDLLDNATGAIDPVIETVADLTDTAADAVGAATDAVGDIVGEATGAPDSVGDTVSGTVGTVTSALGDVLPDLGDGNEAEPGDTDLTVDLVLNDGASPLGVADVDVTLDPVEAILGDIDIDVDAAAEMADVSGTVDDITADTGSAVSDPIGAVTETLGDVLPDLSGGSGSDPDNLLTVDPTQNDGSSPLNLSGLDVDLDSVETIVGDIDIEIGTVADLTQSLGDVANPLPDLMSSDIVTDLGSLDELGADDPDDDAAIASGPVDIDLLEPTGAISEGIGSVIDGAAHTHDLIGTLI